MSFERLAIDLELERQRAALVDRTRELPFGYHPRNQGDDLGRADAFVPRSADDLCWVIENVFAEPSFVDVRDERRKAAVPPLALRR